MNTCWLFFCKRRCTSCPFFSPPHATVNGSFILLSGKSSPPHTHLPTTPIYLSLFLGAFVLSNNGAIGSQGDIERWRGGKWEKKERWCWALVFYGEVVQVNRGLFPLFALLKAHRHKEGVCACACVRVRKTRDPAPGSATSGHLPRKREKGRKSLTAIDPIQCK